MQQIVLKYSPPVLPLSPCESSIHIQITLGSWLLSKVFPQTCAQSGQTGAAPINTTEREREGALEKEDDEEREIGDCSQKIAAQD